MREILQPMWFQRPVEVARADAVQDGHFAGLVERQSGFVFRVVWAVLRNVHDAEDVVQETFLKLYRTGAWRQMNDERAFLARAAWRMALDRLKRKRRAEPLAEPVAGSPTPEQAVIDADRNEIVHRMIDALPEDLRQPLALSAIDELSSREIARMMGIPEGTVRTRIMRAREILKQKLTRANHDR